MSVEEKRDNTSFSLSLLTRHSFCGCWREEASKVFDAVGEAEKRDNTFVSVSSDWSSNIGLFF